MFSQGIKYHKQMNVGCSKNFNYDTGDCNLSTILRHKKSHSIIERFASLSQLSHFSWFSFFIKSSQLKR